jgi:hypothetical protein
MSFRMSCFLVEMPAEATEKYIMQSKVRSSIFFDILIYLGSNEQQIVDEAS